MPIVLRLVLNTGGIPKHVEVRGPPVVDNPSLPGNPLGPTGPMGPGTPSLPGTQSFPFDLYGLMVLYGHHPCLFLLQDHLGPRVAPKYPHCCHPFLYPTFVTFLFPRKPGY